jgi:hypothetical protein
MSNREEEEVGNTPMHVLILIDHLMLNCGFDLNGKWLIGSFFCVLCVEKDLCTRLL